MKKSTTNKKPKPQPLKRINLVYLRESAAKEARDLVLLQEKRDLASIPPPPGYRAVDYNAYREQQLQADGEFSVWDETSRQGLTTFVQPVRM